MAKEKWKKHIFIPIITIHGKSNISTQKQQIASRSSSKAEYKAMTNVIAEVTWVVTLLRELWVSKLKHVTLYCNNQSPIHIAKNPVQHERVKHIAIDRHFTREKVRRPFTIILPSN